MYLQISEGEIKVHKVPMEGGECPSIRSWHAAVCLDYGGSDPHLLMTGGWDNRNPLSDVWLLDVNTWKWKQVNETYSYYLKLCFDFLILPLRSMFQRVP